MLAFVAWGAAAHVPNNYRKSSKSSKAQYRAVCSNSESRIDQAINNVRARLLGGGDCWWDFSDGRYIVPKVDVSTGQQEVSSIFAGSVWLGGIDPAGNLKLACQDYRTGTTNEFWPGPLTDEGITEQFTCDNWDRHFRVTGDEIRKHLRNLANGNRNAADIPRGVKGWPSQDNPFFVDVWGFDLPSTSQGLAGFYDAEPANGIYNPLEGDYPSIEIRGCPLDQYPDEMIFWIYNDHGGGQPHGNTNGDAIQMEVQVQAFGYTTNDELNDMTFQRYKLINRATERIDSTFFAMWTDPDLGCFLDDYIGCDTAKELMYVYNQDAVDGQPNATCADGNGGQVPTYGPKVPLLGVDYFRGPLDTFGNELGMSSFVYYNNPDYGNPPQGTTDPTAPLEFYRYLTGSWPDGAPFTYGGIGRGGDTPIRYAFTEPPNDPNGWSMYNEGLDFGDRRTLQASGPFSLKPGAVNELIIGVPWVPDVKHPAPDMEALFRADKLAQGLFDNCFDLLDGPDAPTADWIELNQEIVVVLTNDSLSNNYREDYLELDFLAPDSLTQSTDPAEKELASYKFEGYKIYQLLDPNVSAADYENPDKARIVYQVDVKNGVSKIYNWGETRDPATNNLLYFPEIQVDGLDGGIRNTFSIKEDLFATGNNKKLINHKKYYYSVIAYGYNNYDTFDPLTRPVKGQQRPYLVGRRNIQIKTVIPRPIVDRVLNSAYGDGVVITRLEGVGAGGNFLDLDEETRARMLNDDFDSTLTYKPGRGPLTVTIFNPFEVKDGTYELSIVDGNMTDNQVAADARWQLRVLPDGPVIASEKTIAKLNEQLLLEYGFSVSIAQTADAGDRADERNGGIGAEIEYADPQKAWLTGYADQESGVFHYVKTRPLEQAELLDPQQGLSTLGDGWFVPYYLADWNLPSNGLMITPAWTSREDFNSGAVGSITNRRAALRRLPNVDIVLTADKSKWSRCMVVESASQYYTDATYPKDPELTLDGPPAPGKPRLMFDLRYTPSVGKDDNDNNGLPDPDGAVNVAGSGIPASQVGTPVRGMGWFPGYAVDVETGVRLNVFFGENSAYKSELDPQYTGRDMLWNPTSQIFKAGVDPQSTLQIFYYDLVFGGQHWLYVMETPYDGCEAARRRFSPEFQQTGASKVQQVKNIAWCGLVQLAPNFQMKSLKDGLVPGEAVIKLRVDNPYQTWWDGGNNNKKTGHPKYQFKIEGREPQELAGVQIENALDSVKVSPNPYYGFSQYETSSFTNIIKITNLPAKCTVTIYSLDGKFIRQYKRDEVYQPYQQISPDIEWDLKNNKGIPVASGVYLIHIDAPGMGERTVKWFGIARQFDPSGL
jgi:hypothetical protein